MTTQITLDFTTETWKDIPGYEGVYQVSDLGNIQRLPSIVNTPHKTRKCRGRIMRAGTQNSGYKNLMLCYKNKRATILIHRIVATAFIPNPENKKCVNHIDGNSSNNRVTNLEWCTYSENELHKIHSLNKKPTICNLNNTDQTDDVLRYGSKNIYGVALQKVLTRLLAGEKIETTFLSEADKISLQKSVYNLRTRFNVPIISKQINAQRFCEYSICAAKELI